jgi:hypothetical protein
LEKTLAAQAQSPLYGRWRTMVPSSGALSGVRRVVQGEGSNVHSAPTSM